MTMPEISTILNKLNDHYSRLQELTQKWSIAIKRGNSVLDNTTSELSSSTSLDADRLNQNYRGLCSVLDNLRLIVHDMQTIEYAARSETEQYSKQTGSKQLVDRSPYGCRCSVIDHLVFIKTFITHYEEELENKEVIITLGLQNTITSTKDFIPLQIAWNTSPFLDDNIASFLVQLLLRTL